MAGGNGVFFPAGRPKPPPHPTPTSLGGLIDHVLGDPTLFRGGACVSSYTGEGFHLGGIIGIPWPGSEAGLGVHVATIRSSIAVFAAIVVAVGVAA